MNRDIIVKPDKSSLINLLREIKEGYTDIPEFQRDFVWESRQMLKLFDSLQKGYSIGSLLFWQPKEEYKSKERFGPYQVKTNKKEAKYVLDGYQRLSTLFGVLSNPSDYGKEYNYNSIGNYAMYYDLENEEFTYVKRGVVDVFYVPIYTLVDTFSTLSFLDELRDKVKDQSKQKEYINKVKNLAKTLIEYEIPYVDIKGGEIQDAVEIFSRVNSTGSKLSKDWMVSALSYEKDNFLLSEKITEFLIELEAYNFETLDRNIILNCIATSSGRFYRDVKLEEIALRKDFKELVEETFENIKKAVQFLFDEVNVIEKKLLPYSDQLVFLTEFFRMNSKNNLLFDRKDELKRWFWITSYSNYFTLYNISNQRKALEQFKEFALNSSIESVYTREADAEANQSFVTNSLIETVNFGSVRMKTLLLFLMKHSCSERFDTTTERTLDIRYLTKNDRSVFAVMVNDFDVSRKYENISKNSKNASFVLEEEFYDKSFLRNNFISEEMIYLYKDGRTEEMLDLRKRKILDEEKIFVEELGIKYTEE